MESFYLTLFLVPPLGLALDIGTQLILCRMPYPVGHVRKQLLSFGIGFATSSLTMLFVLLHAQSGRLDVLGLFAFYILTYTFLGFCFFNAINLNVSSLRIRILTELLRQHPRAVPHSEFGIIYSVSEMLDARLRRLESGSQVRLSSGRYYLRRGTVVHIAHFFSGLHSLLFGRSP